MQHVRIFLDEKGVPIAEPHQASLWRDDQWIMWLLEPPLKWDPDAKQKITFNPATEGVCDHYPGTLPSPQADLIDPEEDRRAFVSYGQMPVSDNIQTYVYDAWVRVPGGDKGVKVRGRHPGTNEEVDPEVLNRPQP